MNDFFQIKEIIKENKKVIINYECSDTMKKYFCSDMFYAEYDFNIDDLPNSILVIPFICNLLPLLWINNVKLVVDEIDKAFIESIQMFKKGYDEMYPEIEFKEIEIKVKKIINNVQECKNVGTFFSGGIDAFATLFAHIVEMPKLITVWGADISTTDFSGWECTKNNVNKVAQMFELDAQYIKSNFKEMFNTSELNKLIVRCPDKWWHGFQHGIGLIGLAAPIAYKFNMKIIYIASSYTKKDKVTCASHPTIDNFVRFYNTEIIHDQYEFNRQEKIENIVNFTKKVKKFPNIHVCWESSGGKNCCYCEKCCRTIMGIYAANGDSSKYGFDAINMKKIKNRMNYLNNIDVTVTPMWNDIIEYYKKNKEKNEYKEIIEWLEFFKPQKNRTLLKKICRKFEKCKKLIIKNNI